MCINVCFFRGVGSFQLKKAASLDGIGVKRTAPQRHNLGSHRASVRVAHRRALRHCPDGCLYRVPPK